MVGNRHHCKHEGVCAHLACLLISSNSNIHTYMSDMITVGAVTDL